MLTHSKAVRFRPMLILACLICALWGVSNAPVSSQPDDSHRSGRSTSATATCVTADSSATSTRLRRATHSGAATPRSGWCQASRDAAARSSPSTCRTTSCGTGTSAFLSQRADDELFKNDATFCLRSGLFNSSARSFESFNRPGHYIRHSAFELWLEKSDGTLLFKKDASFFMERPLTHSFPRPSANPTRSRHRPSSPFRAKAGSKRAGTLGSGRMPTRIICFTSRW